MSLRNHLSHYWPHYTILIGIISRIDWVWEKTEWLRAMIGWTENKKKNKKRRHCK